MTQDLSQIVNADTYESFFAKDWDFSKLSDHFIIEMNKEHLILWATGSEGSWTINFRANPSDKESFREFYQTLEVTNSKIFFTNYEDLTMAAEYEDERIPSKSNSHLSIELDNGKYEFLVRQLFRPEDETDKFDGPVHYEVIARLGVENSKIPVHSIHWATQ